MLTLFSNLILAALISTTPTNEPTVAKPLSFNTSAYITAQKHIRVAVEKSAAEPVVVLLRNDKKEVVFQHIVGKKEHKYVVKLDVNELTDGHYELEVKSNEGSISKHLNLTTPSVEETRTVALK